MNKLMRSFEIIVLLVIGVISIATSKDDGKNVVEFWGVGSNCPGATQTNAAISLANGVIISPAGVKFADFGLPVEINRIGQTPITGTINSVNRTCQYSTQSQNNQTLHIYTCTDSNSQVCLVSFVQNP